MAPHHRAADSSSWLPSVGARSARFFGALAVRLVLLLLKTASLAVPVLLLATAFFLFLHHVAHHPEISSLPADLLVQIRTLVLFSVGWLAVVYGVRLFFVRDQIIAPLVERYFPVPDNPPE